MINENPFVSVIVPTTEDRADYNARIERIFHYQDYPLKELLFEYHPGTIGDKRNRLCVRALGDIIIHQDSDDLYATDWISKSVRTLVESEADVIGLSMLYFYDERNGAWYIYTYPQEHRNNWLAGATFAYRRDFWKSSPFPYKNVGEDLGFLLGTHRKPKVVSHSYMEGFVATIHDGNTCKKVITNPRYRRCTVEEEEVLFERWKVFVTSSTP